MITEKYPYLIYVLSKTWGCQGAIFQQKAENEMHLKNTKNKNIEKNKEHRGIGINLLKMPIKQV